jgi:hypothetical protein
MSESSTETTRTTSGGGFFTRSIGPLPMWGWMAILLVLVVLYAYYKKSKANSASSATTTAQGAANAPGGVDASLVPQFINQTYVQETPPTAPNITVNNTEPAAPTRVAPRPPTRSTPNQMPKPEPATISGAPGSFTTGLPGGMNEWTSTGKYSLNTVAKSHGMTAQQLLAVSESSENNVPLKQYAAAGNFNAPVPAGVQLFIPNANWTIKK